MSINYPQNDSSISITEREDVMFTAQPVWDRNRKRRPGLGRKSAGPTSSATASATAASDRAATPTRSRKVEQRSSTAPVALAAGVVGLAALAGAGWFMTRDAGVPQMNPGEIETMEVAAAPIAPPPPMPTEQPLMETTTAIPPSESRSAPAPQTRSSQMSAPRVDAPSVAAPSVDERGVNASTSAALPEGPQPYTALNPDAGAAPAPVESLAQPVPETPPIQAEPTLAPENPVSPTEAPEETPPL